MAGDISKMTRLMKLVALLRKNSYPNHRKLERALKNLDVTATYSISQKTIQRDVQYLRDVYRAPIAFDNGKRGYYLTNPSWKFEVPQLEEEEMRAVTLGARLAETIMPEPVSSQIQDAAERLLCDNPSGLDANAVLIALVAQGARIPVSPAIFREVFEAWQMRRGLAVKYRRGMTGEILAYILEPQVLAFQDGLWYVKAVIVSENGLTLPERTIRTLALNRIQSAALYPGRFEPDLRLIKEVNEGGLFNFPTIDEVVLRFTDYAIPYARENYEPELIEEQPDGSLLVTIYDAIDFKIVNLVLNEGGAVQVVSPPELAEKVIKQAKRVIQKQEERQMTECALKITHIGEQLFAKALNESEELMKAVIGSVEEKYTAHPEAAFTETNTENARGFDGEHKIDVLLIPEDCTKEAIPIELKLGKTRMGANKSGFGRFLEGYKYNPDRKKFTGSMVSILSQQNIGEPKEKIKYPLRTIDKGLNISKEWVLIVLTDSIKNEINDNNNGLWKKTIKKPKIISFQELFERKENELNEIVSTLIRSENYYQTWLHS